MPVPFGFGVGDFLAVADLAFRITILLLEIREASEGYKSLIVDLEFTTQALNHAGRLQNLSSTLPLDSTNALSYGLSCCRRDLERLMEIVQKHRSGFRLFQKLKWVVLESEDVNKLRDNICKSMGQIHLILSVTGFEVLSRNSATLKQIAAELKDCNSLIRSAIPNDLGFPLACDHKPLLLEDALGRRIPFPYEFAVKQEMFHDILKIYFKGLPGSKWVGASKYTIKTQSYDLLSPTDWGRTIRPNMQLIMSMLIEKVGATHDNSCPSCGTSYAGYTISKELEQVQCTSCFTWYSVTIGPRIVDLPDQAPEPGRNLATLKSHNDVRERQLALELENPDEDMRKFKRLDVVLRDRQRGGSRPRAAEDGNFVPPLRRKTDQKYASTNSTIDDLRGYTIKIVEIERERKPYGRTPTKLATTPASAHPTNSTANNTPSTLFSSPQSQSRNTFTPISPLSGGGAYPELHHYSPGPAPHRGYSRRERERGDTSPPISMGAADAAADYCGGALPSRAQGYQYSGRKEWERSDTLPSAPWDRQEEDDEGYYQSGGNPHGHGGGHGGHGGQAYRYGM